MHSKTDRFSLYHMRDNYHLGNCLAIIYRPTLAEIKSDSLRSDYILILIKSKNDISSIHTIEDIRNNDLFNGTKNILLRIQSECLLGYFGDTHCDCESQRIGALKQIRENGEGMYIFIPQEGQGNGLFYKGKELELQVSGYTPSGKFVGAKNIIDASELLLKNGESLDKRKYSAVKNIVSLAALNRYTFSLMSDNPQKVSFLKKHAGIKISSICHSRGEITLENIGEYLSKLYSKKFVLSDKELREIYSVISNSSEIPERAASVMRFIQEDVKLGKKFNANKELLCKLLNLLDTKARVKTVQDLSIFKSSGAYAEYHTELQLSDKDIHSLFDSGDLISDVSLRYEENYFYDLPYFKFVPCRSLKIRKIFRINDNTRPIINELIYKIPTENKRHFIKCIKIEQDDIVNLIGISLRDNNMHFIPVLTHTVKSKYNGIKVLIKRYSDSLRVISLMGEKKRVNSIRDKILKKTAGKEINNLTDRQHVKEQEFLKFDYNKLTEEEIELFKQYFKG